MDGTASILRVVERLQTLPGYGAKLPVTKLDIAEDPWQTAWAIGVDRQVVVLWHGSDIENSGYRDRRTTQMLRDCGKRVINIYEWEIAQGNWGKIAELILGALGGAGATVVGARTAEIGHAGKEECSRFLRAYHLQGDVSANEVAYKLSAEGQTIGVMTFGTPRFSRTHQHELLRLCWRPGYAVIGGAERLFSAFIREYKPESVLAYSDIAKFSGSVYKRLGFSESKKPSDPGYRWVKDNCVLTRYQTQKKDLVRRGLGSEDMSEMEIMHKRGFKRVQDCGNHIFTWRG